MKILHSQFTIAEVRDMLERGDLTVNKSYQRSPNIWPVDAQSYFIDTILEGYPFPKVYSMNNTIRRRSGLFVRLWMANRGFLAL